MAVTLGMVPLFAGPADGLYLRVGPAQEIDPSRPLHLRDGNDCWAVYCWETDEAGRVTRGVWVIADDGGP